MNSVIRKSLLLVIGERKIIHNFGGEPMNNISVKGISFGAIITLVLDFVSGMAFGMVAFFTARPRPTTQQQVEELIARLMANEEMLMLSLLVGGITTILGGYIAGRWAPEAPLLNALLCGLLGCGAWYFLYFDPNMPEWFNIAVAASIVPEALLGGYLADRRGEEEEAISAPEQWSKTW